ncbi:hypothetical protein TOPH_04574 [Tolypocladium ophioglossoides CBS 100239]|uniref:Uncharacterized protein n=1 Tax=Tolypocladium ophioglossoides (strain CBS 100239) TaxID=1163406 RepID=A0A0L0N9E0_TOLOC|nr:hypothetical protein TOPH_04574 [Tolypocladium ophioglossoides CBS 100239]
MPAQRTFTLIQPVSGPGGGDLPRPMTSKKVRTAYKAANREPKLSRAERIKQERDEQERIRKEFEREKAAARARAAREKKRDKELAKGERRKKNGLPLVSVRPSQDTIANFARGNGAGRKMDAAGQHGVEGVASVVLQQGEEPTKEYPGPCGTSEELDLIPEEDELELEMMEQLDAITTHKHNHEMEPANEEMEPAAAEHRSQNQSRQATTYELDLGLEPVGPPGRVPLAEPAPPPRQAPPPSTQAILHNFDDFFPSSSQQERELQDEKTAEASTKRTEQQQPASPDPTTTPPPKRFFTPSGSDELTSLALQRSRRTAALEEIHQKERLRAAAATHTTARRATRLQWTTGKPAARPTEEEAAKTGDSNKENVAPPADGLGALPSASQETEYGGEWVDEIALELTI